MNYVRLLFLNCLPAKIDDAADPKSFMVFFPTMPDEDWIRGGQRNELELCRTRTERVLREHDTNFAIPGICVNFFVFKISVASLFLAGYFSHSIYLSRLNEFVVELLLKNSNSPSPPRSLFRENLR